MRSWQFGLAWAVILAPVSRAVSVASPATSIYLQSLTCQPNVLTLLGEPVYPPQRPIVNRNTLLLRAMVEERQISVSLELQRLQPAKMSCGPAGKILLLGLALNSFAELLQIDVGSGEIDWATPLLTRSGGKSVVNPVDVQRAPDGTIWVIHNVQGPVVGTVGTGTDILLQQVSAAGELLSTRRLGTDKDDIAAALTLTRSADRTYLWVGGATKSAINFPQVIRNRGGDWNALILEVTSTAGTPLVFGTVGDDRITSLKASADQLYLAGYSDGAWSGTRHDPVNADGFVASLDLRHPQSINASTILAFAQPPRAFGSPLHADHFRTLSLLPNGEVMVAGDTDGTLDNQNSNGQKDVMLVRYSPDLNLLKSSQVGTAGNDSIYDLNIVSTNLVFLTGITTSTTARGQIWSSTVDLETTKP